MKGTTPGLSERRSTEPGKTLKYPTGCDPRVPYKHCDGKGLDEYRGTRTQIENVDSGTRTSGRLLTVLVC